MTPTIASIAITIALVTGDAAATAVSAESIGSPAGGIVPTVDVTAPLNLGGEDGVRRGGQATRIEFDAPDLNAEISAYYRLAFVEGGSRLQVYEHSATGVYGSDSIIVKSEKAAWTVAKRALSSNPGATVVPDLPSWALVHTGNTTGPSAGLIFTLSYIDALTAGALVGDLRVAGTGGISESGYVFTVNGVEVKVATALLANPDVVFSPRPSKLIEHTTVVQSDDSPSPDVGQSVAEWLNLDGYEQAGREAAKHPGEVAFVVVHEFRQALAWLCGRTGLATTCDLVQKLGDVVFPNAT